MENQKFEVMQGWLTTVGVTNKDIVNRLNIIARRSKEACLTEFEVGEIFAKLVSVGCKRDAIMNAYGVEKSKLSIYIWTASQAEDKKAEYLTLDVKSYSATGFKSWLTSQGTKEKPKKYPTLSIPATDTHKGIRVTVDPQGVSLPTDPSARAEVLALCRRILNAASL
jgi:hypothetical protein